MVKHQLRRNNESLNLVIWKNAPSKEYHSNLARNNSSARDNGSRFVALNGEDSEDSEEEAAMQEDAYKKGQANNSPNNPNRNPRGKGKVTENLSASSAATNGNSNSHPSSSSTRTEEMKQKWKDMLEDIRRLENDRNIALEASQLITNPLESFVVKNTFLTQNPLFTKMGEDSGAPNLKMEVDNMKNKPPDINMIEKTSLNKASSQVTLDQNKSASGTKSQVLEVKLLFATLIRDLKREFDASFLMLFETHISGEKGQRIRDKMNFDGCAVEDANGFSGGI
ncbi:hypothetical protein PIB30_049142 [Stylosanthes scabra]|uniref:Uncharacterized protein n=1 Tax=Stylosanthes scabra TaxID=79078 RepID=A0ABU6YJ12_9FABA|nr:hypothetical protein [Stylosanthes scabra]